MQKNILCIGGANIDFKLKASSPFLLGTSNSVNTTTTFGGVARNVAHNLAQLTSAVFLQSVVGDDAEGHALIQHLQALGVNTDYCLMLKNQRTSQYHALLDAQGELFVGLSDMAIYDQLKADFINQAYGIWHAESLLFVDTNLPSTLIDLVLKKAQALGSKLCLDPVSVEKALKIPTDLKGIFLIKPDKQEASALANIAIESINDCMVAAKQLQERGAKNVVITLGQLGYVLVNDVVQIHVKAQAPVQTLDVSGAGDAFLAGILYGLYQGKDVADACHLGAQLATKTIQSYYTVT